MTVTLLALISTGSAFADFEQVNSFGVTGEGVLGEQPGGLAVNTTGAGGVASGTVYVIGKNGTQPLTRYGPKGEFLGTDTVAAARESEGLAIDETTGDIYLVHSSAFGEDSVSVLSPDGSSQIASFGVRGTASETVAESPEKLHYSFGNNPIAVDAAGDVYLSDWSGSTTRVMVFKPQVPGEYDNYVYAGRAADIDASYPEGLAIDAAGHLYVNSAQEAIEEFEPGTGAELCNYRPAGAGALALTVDPQNGEVFYFSEKNRKIHQLATCNAQGAFAPVAEFSPRRSATRGIETLAFNASGSYEPSRSQGILYALDATSTLSESPEGDVFAPAEVRYPVVESESVSAVGVTSATLDAQINPKGSEVRYIFQYIDDAAYEANEPSERFAGAVEAPLGGAELSSSQQSLSAAATLSGLQPETEYRYRVIASSHCEPEDREALCSTVGTAQVFSTYPAEALGLPDGRAYELVSPSQKNGGEVFPLSGTQASCGNAGCKPGGFYERMAIQSAADGESIAYEGYPFSAAAGAPVFNEYLSKHTGAGWQTTDLSPPLASGTIGYREFDAQLSRGVLFQELPSLVAGASVEYPNLYVQPTSDPATLSPLVTAAPPNRPASFRPVYAGGSADFSHLIFAANDTLTEETSFAPAAVDGGANEDNLYESVSGGLRLVNVLPGDAVTAPGASFGAAHAISSDGSRVFWNSESGQAYVREDGERTVEIPDHSGEALTASADGSKLLLTDGKLFDVDELAEEPIDLTLGQGGFQGIVGQSEDLSHVYFVDTAVLTEAENDQHATAQAGEDNLYAWQAGSPSTFVGTLDRADSPSLAERQAGGDWLPAPADRTAEASADGRWVAFRSLARLTGFENIGPACDRNSTGEPVSGTCPEVFLYDSVTGRLTCTSCNPSGERPLGPSNLPLVKNGSAPQPRYLSDGGRLFFDSTDSLSPADTNGRVEDVYEYEPDARGSCSRAPGCVALISAGREPVDSNFLAADASGKNVFFTTRDQLVTTDDDDAVDVYDAREGGGAATETGAGECQGEACQSPRSTAQIEAAPGSTSISGTGNLVAPLPIAAPAKPKAKVLTRAQKLTAALKACRKKAKKKKRRSCEKAARAKYGARAKRGVHHKRGGSK